MSTLDTLIMAFTNLWRRKLRAVLTALGMAIGTTSIVVMFSIGLGFQASFEEQIQNYGSLTKIEVWPSWDQTTGKQTEIDDKMLEQLRQLPHVEAVMPMMNYSGQLKSGRNTGHLNVYGVDFKYAEAFGFAPTEGEVPEGHSGQNNLKIVLTSDVGYNMSPPMRGGGGMYVSYGGNGEEDTPPNVNLIEDKIKFSFDWGAFEPGYVYTEGQSRGKIYTLEVTGIYDNSNSWDFWSQGFVDLDTLEKLAKENKDFTGYDPKQSPYNQVWLKADDMDNVAAVVEEIRSIGLEGYGQGEWISQSQDQMTMIQNVLGAIGAVAMLVAAIGIMNTMMMSIYERTREIGVIKVLGCKMSNILKMFLSESGYIGFFGGILGLLISYGLSFAINTVMAASADMGTVFRSVIPPWLALAGVAFSAAVAILSGLYPAIRAMRLSALEAIRSQ